MKAQISGQVFVYIFSMIVASAVLMFGYMAITSLNKANTEIQATRFTGKLSQDLEASKGFGTVRNGQTYKEIPQKIQEVCFAYIEKINAHNLNHIADSIQIQNSIESSVNNPGTSQPYNVFLIPDAQKYWFHEDNMGVKPESSNNYVRCFPVTNGQLKLRMIGCGNKVIVATPISPSEAAGPKQNGESCSSNSDCQSESYCDTTCKSVCS